MSHAKAARREDGKEKRVRSDKVWRIKYTDDIHTETIFFLALGVLCVSFRFPILTIYLP